MAMTKEEARIEAEVQKRVAAIAAEQQKQFAAMMETAMKQSVSGLDETNAALQKEQKKLEKEFDVVREKLASIEREGEKMAYDAFQKHSRQYREEAQITLLRDLARWHIEVGKSTRDIAVWLDVPQKFVEDIRRVVTSVERYRDHKRKPLEGNPKISIIGEGRGGTIHFESRETEFDLWWEFGYSAFIIVEAPTPEEWAMRTNLPVSRREETLNFIGEQIVLKEATYNGYYIVGENVLTICLKDQEQPLENPHHLFEKK
jgi:hypothetical protein